MINRLDKTTFKHQTKKEASDKKVFWHSKSIAERLEAANYLNSMAYNFDINNPPKIDKTFFRIKKRS